MDITPKKNNIDELNEEQIKQNAKNKALESLKNQKATIVNIDEIADAEARKAADAYMTEDKGKSNFFKKFWKHTFMEGYYRQREINRVREEIKNTGNIYTGRLKNDNKVAHENTMQAIAERFSSEYEGTLSDDEEKKNLDEKDPESLKTKNDIKNLVTEYAKGSLDERSFKEAKNRILNSLNKDNSKNKSSYADNLFEIAKNARTAVEHGAKMEELDLDTNVILGKAKSSLKTEAHFNNVDKIVDKLKKTKVGQFISPTALSASIGLAYSLSVGLGTKVLRSKAAAYGTFGAAVAVSSALAGMNESQRLSAERAQHAVEMAEGSSFEEGSKRRELMEKYQYKMESSQDLSFNLRGLMYEKDKDGKEVLKDIKEEDLEKIFASIVSIDARRSLNSEKNIDLISYSGIGNVEKESTDLILLVAKAKKELRNKIESDFKDGIPDGDSFDSYLAKQTEVLQNSLLRGVGAEKGIDTLDKEFRKFKTKEVAKKVAMTATVGLVLGATVQEGVAFFKDDVQGMFEGMLGHTNGGVTTQTPLDNLRSWITGDTTHMGMNNAIESEVNGNNFRLPEGTSIVPNSDGTYDILKGDQVISDNIKLDFDSNGNLDDDSISRLGEDGVLGNTTHQIVDSTKEVTNDARGWIENHKSETIKVQRDLWFGNDTPNYTDPETGKTLGSDLNELRTHWGGLNGSGVNENGDAILNISKMTADGSFQNGLSVDAQEAIQKGTLTAIIYLDESTQGDGIPVPIGPDGNIIFDHNNPIMQQLFSQDENGQMQFHGKFLEIAERMGTDENGVEHIRPLGTLVGEGLDEIKDVVSSHEDIPTTNLDIPVDTEPPYFIPLSSRRPLEKLKEKKDEEVIDTNDYFYAGFSEIKREDYENRMSEKLKNNPDLTLNEKEEIRAYLEKQNKEHFKDIEKLAKEAGPMSNDCKLSVCIPVAGHQEEKVIYQTLENYLNQTANKNDFEIVLLVNHPDKDDKGNIIVPDGTIPEIKRFMKDHPEIKVTLMQKVIPFEKAKIGYVRKLLNDAVLKRNLDRGDDSLNHIILSNDADNKGVSTEYIKNFINKFEKNPNVDSYMGQLDWDPESYIRNPLVHIGTRLFQYVDMQIRHKNIPSSGANFAFRSGMYAAINGYSSDSTLAEDVDLGKAIKAARIGAKNKKAIDFAGARVSRLFTSSRRAEKAIKDGLSPVEQWDKGFSAFDDEVRKVDWQALSEGVNYKDKEKVKILVDQLENVINRTINAMSWIKSDDFNLFKRSIGLLGIKFEMAGDKNIKITDASKLIKGLEIYKKQGLKILERKTTPKKKSKK